MLKSEFCKMVDQFGSLSKSDAISKVISVAAKARFLVKPGPFAHCTAIESSQKMQNRP